MTKRKSTTYRVAADHSLSLEGGAMAGPGVLVTFAGQLADGDQARVDSGQLVETDHVPEGATVIEVSAPAVDEADQGGAAESPTIPDEVSDSSGDNGE